MRLTLFLPGLLLPGQTLRDTAADLELPALSRLLGCGRLRRDSASGHYDRLREHWTLAALPAAALRLCGEGGAPGGDDWLCLDPVGLSVGRRAVRLDDPATLALAAAEDAALREALAPLLAGFGELHGLTPGRWYLRLKQDCELVTQPLPEAIGYEIDPALPAGRDGARWRRLLAEAQMLLHDHPVNRLREAAGRPVASSLWPWGQGRLALPLAAPFSAVWSSDPAILGLARAADIPGRTPPARYEPAAGHTLAVIDELAAPARRLDALAWRETLADLEARWFAPLQAALRSGRCRRLQFEAFGPGTRLALDVTPFDLWKPWRRPRPLAELAP